MFGGEGRTRSRRSHTRPPSEWSRGADTTSQNRRWSTPTKARHRQIPRAGLVAPAPPIEVLYQNRASVGRTCSVEAGAGLEPPECHIHRSPSEQRSGCAADRRPGFTRFKPKAAEHRAEQCDVCGASSKQRQRDGVA